MSTRRDYLQGANVLDIDKHGIGGRMWSEKMNGMRCFWDGGISTSQPKADVPWANTKNDSRYKIPPVATGLWTKYGNVIHAPHWFLESLPRIPLDGELWNPKLSLQSIMSIVKTLIPDTNKWRQITFNVFDMPAPELTFGTGVLKNQHIDKIMSISECMDYIGSFNYEFRPKPEFPFWKTYALLERVTLDHEIIRRVEHYTLPNPQKHAWQHIQEELERITNKGGEGIVLRHPDFPYICKKNDYILKIKKYDDAEGLVIGYTSGREGKEGRLLGLMGNVIMRLDNGDILEISGFKENERSLSSPDGWPDASSWCADHPGKPCPSWVKSVLFPLGTQITFRHRGFTHDGIPNEAHYHRVREPE